jgi:hypothetical protein
MIVITKKFGTYVSLKNLNLSPRRLHCSLGKVLFSLSNLGPSSKKIHSSFEKLYFSPGNFYYSMGNFFGIGT